MDPGPAVTVHTAPVVLPIGAASLTEGAVAVAGERIVAVGGVAEIGRAHPGAPLVRWPGVLTPGLVNAHAHLELSAYADLASAGLPFFDWIGQFARRNRTMTRSDWLASARTGISALLRSGTTCVADVVTRGPGIEAVAAAGLAGISYPEVVGVDDTSWPDKRTELIELLAAAPPARTIGVSPHTVYTIGSAVAREAGRLARERGLRLHPHAAETLHEAEYVATGTGALADFVQRAGLAFELVTAGGSGRSPVAELEWLGLLGPDVHVAHGTHVDAADRALLRERGTAVALCTRSNGILGSGQAPVAAYLAEGSPVAIGTDSLASAPDLDLLAEAAALRDLALGQGAPSQGLARRIVEAATVGGTAAMGLSGVGRLRPGDRADLAVFDVPVGDSPYDALLEHGPGRCVGTVLAGRLVHDRRVRR